MHIHSKIIGNFSEDSTGGAATTQLRITQWTAYKLMKKQGHQAANSVGEDQVCMSSMFNDPSTIDYVFRIPPFQGGCGTAGPMDWEKLQ